jgi:1-deoxy-D-xylulose-5-phosphate reductoisomerase
VLPQQIEVVIHPQSVIHSMVQFVDGSVVAQLGTPDMRVPIAYGLSWPERITSGAQALDFHNLKPMTFEAIDDHGHEVRFPGLKLAWQSLKAAPGTCAVLNAANEIAVEAFLNKQIRFDQIHQVNMETLAKVVPSSPQNLDDLLALDGLSRAQAHELVGRIAVA